MDCQWQLEIISDFLTDPVDLKMLSAMNNHVLPGLNMTCN